MTRKHPKTSLSRSVAVCVFSKENAAFPARERTAGTKNTNYQLCSEFINEKVSLSPIFISPNIRAPEGRKSSDAARPHPTPPNSASTGINGMPQPARIHLPLPFEIDLLATAVFRFSSTDEASPAPSEATAPTRAPASSSSGPRSSSFRRSPDVLDDRGGTTERRLATTGDRAPASRGAQGPLVFAFWPRHAWICARAWPADHSLRQVSKDSFEFKPKLESESRAPVSILSDTPLRHRQRSPDAAAAIPRGRLSR